MVKGGARLAAEEGLARPAEAMGTPYVDDAAGLAAVNDEYDHRHLLDEQMQVILMIPAGRVASKRSVSFRTFRAPAAGRAAGRVGEAARNGDLPQATPCPADRE